jgi:hypothetical protein
MLASGALASLLYGVLDFLAGTNYEGYSFYSQTISELGAIGAPQASWLAPLFLLYDALMLAFAIGVLLEGTRNRDRTRVVGLLLLFYLLIGAGTAVFPVHVRGTASFAAEIPHIVAGLMAIAVMLTAMAIGSKTLGRSFQVFTWIMAGMVILFGAITAPFGARIAAGEPTPGMGLYERLAYYSMLAWVAGLSVMLLRRRIKYEDHKP